MKISRTIAYAVHAMTLLSRSNPGVPIPCSQLAQEGQMPERFLLQVLRSLVTSGLLQSARGVEGGYFLTRSPEEISLRDVVEAFDNPLNPYIPPLDGMRPEVRNRLMDTLQCVSEAAREELGSLTIADLVSIEPLDDQDPSVEATQISYDSPLNHPQYNS